LLDKKQKESQRGSVMLGLRDWSSFLLYIMERQYIIAIIWLSGFLLSHWMLKVEHESENDDYTNGDKAWAVLLSLLSLVMVLIMLAKAWAYSVNGYWNKTADKKVKPGKSKTE